MDFSQINQSVLLYPAILLFFFFKYFIYKCFTFLQHNKTRTNINSRVNSKKTNKIQIASSQGINNTKVHVKAVCGMSKGWKAGNESKDEVEEAAMKAGHRVQYDNEKIKIQI